VANNFKMDSKKVKYDGRTIKLIIENEIEFMEWLKQQQKEILKDLGLLNEQNKKQGT